MCDSPICACLTIAILIVAGARLRTYANAISDLDTSRYILAHFNSLANDLVADADRVLCWTPTRSESVKV